MASKDIKYGHKNYSISYEIKNSKCDDAVVFLHGWGANKEIMKKAFCSVLCDFKHVYIDMPGFGGSEIFHPLHTKDYAKIIQSFLDELKIVPKIIIGHSFGGKVATIIKPEILVLLSTAGIVTKKPFWVKFKISVFKILKVLGFGFLYKFFATNDVKGMSKNMYETLKNVVDEDFSYKFASFSGKAFIFWGSEDKTTPLSSGERINSLIVNSKLYPLKGDHFFFLLHAKFIDGVITEYLKNGQKFDFESDVGEVKVISKSSEKFSKELENQTNIFGEPKVNNIKEQIMLFDNEDCSGMKQCQDNKTQIQQNGSFNEFVYKEKKHKKEPKSHKIPKQQVFDL